MSEYTPGPWRAVHRGMSDEHDVMAVNAFYDEDLWGQRGMFAKGADARLAAAAPDLLEAAKAVLDHANPDPDDGCTAETCEAAYSALEAAVARAEGGGE